MEFHHCLGTLGNVHIGTFMKWKWKDIERGERLDAVDDHERAPHGGGVLGAVVGELGVGNAFLPVRAIRGVVWEWSVGYEVDAVLDSTKRRKAMRKLFGEYTLEFLQNSHQRRRNICQVVSSLR